MLYPIQNDIRNKLDLSGIWDFQPDFQETGEQDGWFNGLASPRPMAVPGSWNEQYEDLQNYLGLSWYIRRTYGPSGWRGQRVFLRVGSANYYATVYVNGVKTGAHEGGHLPFAFEITDRIQWGQENIVAISMENLLQPTRVPSGNIPSAFSAMASFLPTTFDFFPFAGLHRPVVLYTVPQTYIEDVTVVTGIDGSSGTVEVSVALNAPISVNGIVYLSGGNAILEAPLAFENGLAKVTFHVPDARFWSDRAPYLYDLSIRTGEDHYALKIGIRTITVQDGQILLNGEPARLNGFGRHEDFLASGRGLNLPLMVKDYQLMRWTGANSYRTSHYPYSEEEMQLADRQGFLIIDEIPAVSLQFDNDENIAARLRMCLQQVEDLIARDKNHPSVVMWCVANEPMPRNMGLAGAGSGANEPDPAEAPGKAFLETLMDRVRELDPTRLVTIVAVMGGPLSWMEQCDVVCMNRYWGWYVLGGNLDQALAELERELDGVWHLWQKPIVMTEFGADTVAGMHGHPSMMWTEEYQAELIRGHLRLAACKPYVAGMQVWNFADFAAVQSIMRVGGFNMKGIFTRARQPKMAAHVLREFWAKT
jgi:beta-glucuronidase